MKDVPLRAGATPFNWRRCADPVQGGAQSALKSGCRRCAAVGFVNGPDPQEPALWPAVGGLGGIEARGAHEAGAGSTSAAQGFGFGSSRERK